MGCWEDGEGGGDAGRYEAGFLVYVVNVRYNISLQTGFLFKANLYVPYA